MSRVQVAPEVDIFWKITVLGELQLHCVVQYIVLSYGLIISYRAQYLSLLLLVALLLQVADNDLRVTLRFWADFGIYQFPVIISSSVHC